MALKFEGLNEIKSYLYAVKGKEDGMELWELQLSRVHNICFGKATCVQGTVTSMWQNKWITLDTTDEERALEILKDKVKRDLY